MRGWLFAVTLVTGCAGAEADPALSRPFPSGFLWGSATAGFQVDMGCPTWSAAACDDPHSDWYQWVNTPEIINDRSLFVTGEPVSAGPGMWELYEADIARMQADGHTAYRFSFEWSRIFPDAAAGDAATVDALAPLANASAVARYHEILDALRAAGITPVATVNHYTLPLWAHDGVACHDDLESCPARGWVDSDVLVPQIALYSGFLGREFGSKIDLWMTLNEPFATTISGYTQPGEDRSAPPGLTLAVEPTIAVMLGQIEGHAAMTDALRANDTVDADGDGRATTVGIVMNMVDIRPNDPGRALDVEAAANIDYLYHQLYLQAVTEGLWDDDLDGTPDRTRPELAGRLDILGINYYNEVVVTGLPFAIDARVPTFTFLPAFSWDPHPVGLGRVVQRARAFGVPLLITENGTPHVEEQGVQILDEHLSALHEQIADGADVRGYLYWSFVDNYEWNHGFDLRFGLYALDGATKERRPRPVRDRLAVIAAQNGLE